MLRILVDGCWENVFLLPGDDRAVHLYRESRLVENDGESRDQVSKDIVAQIIDLYFGCHKIGCL